VGGRLNEGINGALAGSIHVLLEGVNVAEDAIGATGGVNDAANRLLLV
jgi:hypothetical protein